MFYVTYAAYDALGDTKYMNFVLVLFFCISSIKTQIFSRGNITKKAFEIQAPGDSIHDLFIPKRWRSRLQPLKGSRFHHPQKGHENAELPGNSFSHVSSLSTEVGDYENIQLEVPSGGWRNFPPVSYLLVDVSMKKSLSGKIFTAWKPKKGGLKGSDDLKRISICRMNF